ncbi:MAG TPA: endolytic transglycosylase MltG [Candidatus Binataceae bacterium]|nr:endolytic transglycosylase MltG [Candidatus Binataceae bacterium]
MPKTKIAIALLAVLTAMLSAAFSVRYYWILAPEPFESPRLVAIERGERFRTVAAALARAGVVRSATAMVLYGELTGQARQIKPGDYEFRGGERIPDVMRHLVSGDFVVITVVVPEGLDIDGIAERLQLAGLACQGDFERAARRGPVVRALGLEPLGAEGFLFPATYRFSPRVSPNEVLEAMLARFYQVLTPRVEERMFALGLTARQLVTMASIVEKEAKVAGERPLIASVFYNRLRRGMPLQSDPTAEYSVQGQASSAATAVRIPSEFNTYARAGLPPGPIANPGLRSIDAALYPAQSEFLYFVARDDGTHVFSRSFDEHRRTIAALKRSAARSGSPPKPLVVRRAN